MQKYEYRVVQGGAGAAISHLNERLNSMAEEGWEVVMISGDQTVNVLVRRERKEQAAAGAQPPASQTPTQ
ncbi:MAG: DUF4177 domain-containing protein [Armatimonadetes bacterium]|nr:DUF4177 domain-containing protein [Armatimonadota bacterium]